MKKKGIIIAIIVGLAIASVGAVKIFKKSEAKEAASVEQMEKEEAQKEEKEKENTVEAYGIVEAAKEQIISVDFNARVDKIYVQEGQRIKEKMPLVDFDVSELKKDISNKKLDVEENTYKLSNLGKNIEKLNLKLQQQQEDLKRLREDVEKDKRLFENGAKSSSEYEKIKQKIEDKEREIEMTKVDIKDTQISEDKEAKTLNNSITKMKEDIDRLNKKYLKLNLVNGNQLVSSIKNGVVAEISAKEGAYVDRERPVMKIIDLDTRIIKADIAEEFIKKIKVGQKVTVTPQGNDEKVYRGKVSRIWGTAIKKSGEVIVPIEIVVEDIDDDLYLNFNVDAKIHIGNK